MTCDKDITSTEADKVVSNVDNIKANPQRALIVKIATDEIYWYMRSISPSPLTHQYEYRKYINNV